MNKRIGFLTMTVMLVATIALLTPSTSNALTKVISGGEDRPDRLVPIAGEMGDGKIDKVLPAPGSEVSTYDFTIYFDDGETTNNVVVIDTVPAEWQVVAIAGEEVTDGYSEFTSEVGTVKVFPANKKKGENKNKNKSATKIEWIPNPAAATLELNVVIETRERPRGHGAKAEIKWVPTSCGALYLNDGAIGYEIDENDDLVLDEEGNSIVVLGPSNSLFLVAVADVNGDGIIDRTGDGDEDGDTLKDFAEVAEYGTDPCSDDTDGDGVLDADDNCPLVSNPDQEDTDSDGEGDACDVDDDGDGYLDVDDNCPLIANDQTDKDDDGIGDVCDTCPNDADNDVDADGVCGDEDNCPGTANSEQHDADGDGEGDVCDACTDIDGDGLGDPGFPANTCDEDPCPNDPENTCVP